jgi:hypothetical protein
LKETGRRLDLVTGRELLRHEDANLDFFDRVAAENGAVVYEPRAKRSHVIGDRPPAALVSVLEKKRSNRCDRRKHHRNLVTGRNDGAGGDSRSWA